MNELYNPGLQRALFCAQSFRPFSKSLISMTILKLSCFSLTAAIQLQNVFTVLYKMQHGFFDKATSDHEYVSW